MGWETKDGRHSGEVVVWMERTFLRGADQEEDLVVLHVAPGRGRINLIRLLFLLFSRTHCTVVYFNGE